MSYVFTGVQHTKSGDVIIPSFEFETEDAYKAKYHQEMAYAMASDDFLGLGIKVFDKGTLADALVDNWVKAVEPVEPVAE